MKHFFVIIAFTAFTFALFAEDDFPKISNYYANAISKTWKPKDPEIEKIRRNVYQWETEKIRDWKWKEIYNYVDYLHYTKIQWNVKYNKKAKELDDYKQAVQRQIFWNRTIIGLLLLPWIFLVIFFAVSSKKTKAIPNAENNNLCCPYCGTPRSADETQCQNCKTWFGPFQKR